MMQNKRKISAIDPTDGVSGVRCSNIDCSPPREKRFLFLHRKLPIHYRQIVTGSQTVIPALESLASTEEVHVSSSDSTNSINATASVDYSHSLDSSVNDIGDQNVQSDIAVVDNEGQSLPSSEDKHCVAELDNPYVMNTGCVISPAMEASNPPTSCTVHPTNSSNVAVGLTNDDELFVPRDIATTSPLSIKLARRTVAPLKFDNSSLETGDTSNDESDNDYDDFVSISDTSESSSHSSLSTSVGTENNCRPCRRLARPSYNRRRNSSNSSGGIRFHSYVKVVNIPSRFAYTTKQKRRMWNGENAIRQNAKRNKVEYEWEGWHWQNVIEEDEFTVVDGQLIHPAHTMS